MNNNAIENQACKIINEYIEYWSDRSNIEDYNIEHLDSKFNYLLYAYNKKIIDIFNYNNSIFSTLFLVL